MPQSLLLQVCLDAPPRLVPINPRTAAVHPCILLHDCSTPQARTWMPWLTSRWAIQSVYSSEKCHAPSSSPSCARRNDRRSDPLLDSAVACETALPWIRVAVKVAVRVTTVAIMPIAIRFATTVWTVPRRSIQDPRGSQTCAALRARVGRARRSITFRPPLFVAGRFSRSARATVMPSTAVIGCAGSRLRLRQCRAA